MNDIDAVYSQRNQLAVAFARMAIMAGLNAGRGVDAGNGHHLVYVELPGGEQVSWHLHQCDAYMLDGLPEYCGGWDGKYTGREPDWSKLIPILQAEYVEPLTDYAERMLSGFALKRWNIERRKLALEGLPEADVEGILRSYVKAWSRQI